MATTINVLCYRSKTLKNGEHPLMLCICKDRARKYTSLNLSVKAEHWNSSIAITKRYLGLRQEEILETYDVLSFWDRGGRHFLRRNVFIVPVQILSPLLPTFWLILVLSIPITEIVQKTGLKLAYTIRIHFIIKIM